MTMLLLRLRPLMLLLPLLLLLLPLRLLLVDLPRQLPRRSEWF